MSIWEEIKAERKEDRQYFENSKIIHKALEGKLFSSEKQIIEGLKEKRYGFL